MARGFFDPQTLTKYPKVLLRTLRTPALTFFVIVGNVILLSCMFVFFHNEAPVNPNVQTFMDALWWGMSTVSTVGYGDIVPMTIGGRIAGMVLMVLGGVFFTGFMALFVTTFVAIEAQESEREIDLVLRRLEDLTAKIERLQQK